MKLKLVQQQIGVGLLIANKPPGRIIMMMGQSEEALSSSQIIFITLFSAGWTTLLRPSPATANCVLLLGQSSMFSLFFIQFLLCRITC
jgi:hypothetical protein